MITMIMAPTLMTMGMGMGMAPGIITITRRPTWAGLSRSALR